ncbi:MULTISPECIES: hypothetical protein [Nocardia]|uniref:DUF4254 domain-containing protein n=1 Tax=Nocardia africana TaxID=134964 RepID=A0A378WJZ2_9NOCA|nr:hypothetical protein [Nocardia africana]MCC3317998.1 hypothetical protein [Nocardia africana]SUA40724.1 Uncharacterised protein [Nocardia africana]
MMDHVIAAADLPGAPPPVPSVAALFSALQGPGRHGMATPLAESVGQISELLRVLIADPRAGVDIRARLGEIVAEVDRGIACTFPRPRPGAPWATESFGGLLNRVIEAWEVATWARDNLPADDDLVHRSWTHLAEMKLAYETFQLQVSTGGIQVPLSWPGIETIRQ